MTGALHASGVAMIAAAVFLTVILAGNAVFSIEMRPPAWRPWAVAGVIVLAVVGAGFMGYTP